MSIAISDEHRSLAETVSSFLDKHDARGAARKRLEGHEDGLPNYWSDAADLGWLGLHLPEDVGGSGFGLEELVVVVEELGRAIAPGPFVPTLIASSAIAAAGAASAHEKWLPRLASGELAAGIALSSDIEVSGSSASGTVEAVLGAATAGLIAVVSGDDLVLVDAGQPGVDVTSPKNMDPARQSGRVTLDGASAEVLAGAGSLLVDFARTLLAAEATGVARETTTQAAEYAKERQQFGRPIAMFQAVKHHCANMLVATELATAAVWDAARAADLGGDQFTYAAAVAATKAVEAADLCAPLNIQVHGGIGFTWEHDAHLYLRRAAAIGSLLGRRHATAQLVDLVRGGVKRDRSIQLPPEAEPLRDDVRSFANEIKDLDADAQRERLIETGYVMPHWPKPWGRDAGAVEQLVIEQEFAEAGITRPSYSITGWVILTLIQHGTADQVERWVRPALAQDVIWCQLFSEPDAGSDAAGIKTRGTRVDGGWLVTGQKVWTSGAHVAGQGFATVRTNPDAPKHQGITTMVIDMHADGVEVRPLQMPTGQSEFNEVFFTDVFVPDDDVVGPVDGGWTVARATLGNESVSIGSGDGGMSMPPEALIPMLDANPDGLYGGAARIGKYIASHQAMGLMNLRTAHRAVAGGGPGPEGNVAKLVLTDIGHDAAAIMAELAGEAGVYLDGPAMIPGTMVLMNRAMSIAGGTSEIKRNQIGERILGLPRDPLIK